MQDFIENFIALPIWTRVFLDVIALIYFFYIKKQLTSKHYSILGYVVLVLIVREILTAFPFFHSTEVFVIADLLIILILLMWSRQFHTDSSKATYIYILFFAYTAVLIISLISGKMFFFTNKDGEIISLHWVMRIISNIFIIILAMNMHTLSKYNIDTPEANVVITMRKRITILLVTFNTLLLLIGDTLGVSINLLHPMLIFIYLSVFHTYSSYIIKSDRKTISNLTGDLDSLFDFMKTIGNAISERQEISIILDNISTSTAKNLNADGGAILLIDNYENVIKVESVFGIFPPPFQVIGQVKTKLENMENFFKNKPIEIGEGLIGKSIKDLQPVLIKNSYNDERLIHNTKNDLMFISSIIIIPLVASNKTLGALAVCQRNRNKLFTDADFANMKTFADYTSITLDNFFTYMELLDKKEMEREVGIAADIQQKLLPSRIPKIKDTTISAFTKPAKGVSGDYYDIIKLKGGAIALVMCDVAGKGVPASLVMIMIRTIIQLIAGATRSASTIVSWINRGITGKIDIDHFATLSFLKYDPETKTIEYSNAGHHPLMLYRAKTKTIESVDTPGLPIGIEPSTEYTQKTIQFYTGDIALLYTDGIIEAMNTEGEQYSYESLEKYVKENYTQTSEEIVSGLHQDIKAFVGKAKQHDDQTLLALKVN